MATVTWETPTSFSNVLTTELNSLANNTASALSTAVDNSTALDMFSDVCAILASITPTGNAYLELHLCKRLSDATNYEDISNNTLVGQAFLTTTASIKYAMFRPFNDGTPILIPPGFFKWGIINRSGVTLAASGSIIAARNYGQTVA